MPIGVIPNAVCADYAQAIYNDAEAAGIKTAFVAVRFADGSVAHAFNFFETTDRGSVFIDCTAPDLASVPAPSLFGGKIYGGSTDYNKVAYVEVGQPLGFISLNVAGNFGFDYPGYQEWQREKSQFDNDLQTYNNEIGRYGSGNVIYVPPDVYADLQNKEVRLDQEAQTLGGFWENLGIVKSIQIYW